MAEETNRLVNPMEIRTKALQPDGSISFIHAFEYEWRELLYNKVSTLLNGKFLIDTSNCLFHQFSAIRVA